MMTHPNMRRPKCGSRNKNLPAITCRTIPSWKNTNAYDSSVCWNILIVIHCITKNVTACTTIQSRSSVGNNRSPRTFPYTKRQTNPHANQPINVISAETVVAARLRKTAATVASANPSNRNPSTAQTEDRLSPSCRSSFKTKQVPPTVIKIPTNPALVGTSFRNIHPNTNARIGRIAFSGPNTERSAARNAAIIARFPSASSTPPSKLSTQNELGGRTHVTHAATNATGNINPYVAVQIPSTGAPRFTSRFCMALAETLSSARMAIMIVNCCGDVICFDWGLKDVLDLPSFATDAASHEVSRRGQVSLPL